MPPRPPVSTALVIKADRSAITEFKDDYRFLSNFYPAPIRYRGKIWPTVEHAYQAEKFVDRQVRRNIHRARSPGNTKYIARSNTAKINPLWHDIKYGIMYRLLRIKFRDKKLRQKLLATGTQPLIEGNSWGDTEWGVYQGVGKNMLGKLLMQIRLELQGE